MNSAKSLRPGGCQRTRPGVVFLATQLTAATLVLSIAVAQPLRAQQRPLGSTDLAAARRQLIATDSAHGSATKAEGLTSGFVRYLADDAVYLEPRADHVHARAAIQALLAREPPGQRLSFHPALADVSSDGAVGYTVGWTMLTTAGSDSGIRHGKYISFWRRQPDGNWKVEAWNRSGAQDAPAAAPRLAATRAARFRGSRSVDPGDEARKLRSVDSAFAAMSVARGTAEAFYHYAAPDALSLGGGTNFVVGRDAIRDEQAADAAPGQTLDWKPVASGVGPLGDLGWTVGEYRFTVPRNDTTVSVVGKYLTIWAKQRDGAWRFVADGGSSTVAPAP
jgi:ketosteroid isomerase-like protein